MKNKLFFYFLILVVIIIGIVSISVAFGSKEEDLLGKTIEEINFVEDRIIAMMNSLNNINLSGYALEEETKTTSKEKSEAKSDGGSSGGESKDSSNGENSSEGSNNSGENKGSETKTQTQTVYNLKSTSILLNQEQEINWDYIKTNTEMLYSRWSTMVLDLHELNVSNDTILNFTTILDQVTISEKAEDKAATLTNFANLYALLPNYRNQISNDNRDINIDYTKYYILNSYSLIAQDKWNDADIQLDNALGYYLNIMNSVDIKEKTQNRINKVYILLNELKSSITTRDKDLFYIKYRNLMEEIMNL